MAMINTTSHSSADDVARALDPEVRGAELVALATHRDIAVRAAVASRKDAPMATLISLAHEKDVRVLEALVDNPASPLWVVRKLATGRKSDVRARALARLRLIEPYPMVLA